jgi:hypothetical protein
VLRKPTDKTLGPAEKAMLDFIKQRLAEGALAVAEKEVMEAVTSKSDRRARCKPAYRYGLQRLLRRHVINAIDDRDGQRHYYIGNAPTAAMWEFFKG